MADAFVGIDEAATIDKRLDAESRVVNGLTVLLERLRITGAGERYMDVNLASEGLVHDADVLAAVNAVAVALADVATETTLGTLATEATVAGLLTEATFTAEDFATQVTLEAARVLLASLDGKDYATQATLATRASQTTLASLPADVANGVSVDNFPADFPDAAVLAALAEVDVDVQALTGAQVRSVQPGAVAARIDSTPATDRRTVSVWAHPDNTGIVYVGFDNTVTVSSPSAFTATGGIPLEAGSAQDLDLAAGQGLWAIAADAADVVAVAEGTRA